MSIRIACPSCGAQLNVADECRGKQVRCGQCQRIMLVPGPVAPPAAVPPKPASPVAPAPPPVAPPPPPSPSVAGAVRARPPAPVVTRPDAIREGPPEPLITRPDTKTAPGQPASPPSSSRPDRRQRLIPPARADSPS